MMSWLTNIEVWGAVTGFLCVFLAARENMWSYPFGIINIVLWIKMFYDVQLYADVTLQCIFLVLTIYGWVHWKTGFANLKDVRKTERLSWNSLAGFVGAVIIVTPIFGLIYKHFTNAALPFADSFILVASLVAQRLLSGKYIDNWIFWIMVNIVAVPTYFSRGLFITGCLYIVFLANAFYGYYSWKKQMKLDREANSYKVIPIRHKETAE